MQEETALESGMRKDHLGKDKYYMAIALLSAERSKDPDTQVGACIVNNDDRIVGIGYNGTPNNLPDENMPWRDGGGGNPLKDKNLYECHGELNAIVNKYAADVRGCRMYVTIFPCNECAKIIVQSGITKVIFLEDPKPEDVKTEASKIIFRMADVKFEKLKIHDDKPITLKFSNE